MQSGPQSTSKSRGILAVVFLTVFIDLLGFGITIPLNPHLATKMGADSIAVGQLMAIYSLLQFLMSPVWGRLSDRFGRRPIMLLSIAGTGISHLAFAFSSELWMLFIARGFAGFFGANIATAMACMADVSSPEERSKNMGLVGAAFGLGFLFGPLIGGFGGIMGESLGTNPPFGMSFGAVIAAALSLVNLLMAIRRLPETLPPEKRAQVKRQSRLQSIMVFARKPVTNLLMLIYFLSVLAMAMMEPMMFLYMKEKFGWDLKTSSFGFAYVGVIMVLTQGVLIRRLLPLLGERVLLVGGLIAAGVGLLGIATAGSVWEMAFAVTMLGLGTGLSNPSITGSISLTAATTEQGLIIGVTQSLASLSRILGPDSSGRLYSSQTNLPFLVGAGLVVVALVLVAARWSSLPQSARR
jgi:multidrug resistance protein